MSRASSSWVLLCLVVLLAGLSTFSQAHFILTVPASRGQQDDLENQTHCGGFNTPITAVALVSGNPVQVLCLDGHGDVTVNFAQAGDFGKVTKLGIFSINSNTPGNVNAFSLDFSGFSNGTAGILQLVYQELDSSDVYDQTFYQCADVLLVYSGAESVLRASGIFGIWVAVALSVFLLRKD